MSVHTIERILWEICNIPERGAQMKENPQSVISGQNLTEAEQDMVRNLDVRALANYNVNQMLIMMTWNVLNGAETFPEYIGRMNALPAQPDGSC